MCFHELFQGFLGELEVDERIEAQQLLEEHYEVLLIESKSFVDQSFHQQDEQNTLMEDDALDVQLVAALMEAQLQLVQVALLLQHILLHATQHGPLVLLFEKALKDRQQMHDVALQVLDSEFVDILSKERPFDYFLLKGLQIKDRCFFQRHGDIAALYPKLLHVVFLFDNVLSGEAELLLSVSLAYRVMPFYFVFEEEDWLNRFISFSFELGVLFGDIPRRGHLFLDHGGGVTQRMQLLVVPLLYQHFNIGGKQNYDQLF